MYFEIALCCLVSHQVEHIVQPKLHMGYFWIIGARSLIFG